MVIYETVVRDFAANKTYQDLIDKIDYFKNLKINAIQLMPVMEFEGNESWGYNTVFHMAPDKRYGPPAKLKEFIDLCHQNGIAVILDIALNHVFGRSPLERMWMLDTDGDGWADGTGFRTSTQNPYINQTATHAYGVGSDINHFGTGSHETLNMSIEILRNKMIEFYKTYYNPDNMCLTILSNKPINIIEKLIINSFGNIKHHNNNINNYIPKFDIISKFDIILKEYQIIPVSEQNYILYFWDMLPLSHYRYDMLIYIINEIININSNNNLLNILIEKKLGTSINTHFLEEGVYILLVNVSKDVVYKKAIIEINNIIREYFNNLNKLNWTEIYKYMIDKYKLNYEYSMKDDNLDITKTISVNMHYYKEENIYNGTKIILEKNFDKIFTTLKYLTFNKVNIIYGTKDKLCNVKMKEGKYYKYLYCMLNTTYINNSTNIIS